MPKHNDIILSPPAIPFNAIKKWPPGASLTTARWITDMSGVLAAAVILIWVDREHYDVRKAAFSLFTGDYIGEAL